MEGMTPGIVVIEGTTAGKGISTQVGPMETYASTRAGTGNRTEKTDGPWIGAGGRLMAGSRLTVESERADSPRNANGAETPSPLAR